MQDANMYDIVCMHVRYACMMYAGKQAGMYVYIHHIARELIIASETLFSAASKRKERSGLQTRSSVFSFAQLRAETCGNDAWEAPGKH